MNERDLIMEIRRHTPDLVRTLAELAQQTTDQAVRRKAVSQLASRGFLSSRQPTNDDDLQRIENMTDDEIMEVMKRGHQ